MKQVIITIMAVLAVLAIIGQVSIYNDKKNASQNTVNKEAVAKQFYMSGCTDAKGNIANIDMDKLTKFCECVWGDLTSKYPVDKITEIGTRRMPNGEVPKELVDSAKVCIWAVQ